MLLYNESQHAFTAVYHTKPLYPSSKHTLKSLEVFIHSYKTGNYF